MEIARRKRIRRVVSELNKARRAQSRKIDILCNDFIVSQKNFLKQLQIMNLQLELYESLIGESSVEHVIEDAIDSLAKVTGNASIAVWVGSGFEAHVFNEQEFTSEQTDLIESCFNEDIAERIYKSRRCIELEELFEMGLAESAVFGTLAAAAIPLQDIFQQGFILIYRSASRPITAQELNDISAFIPGLSKAVRACQKAQQTAAKS